MQEQDVLPSERDFIENAEAFHRLTEASESSDIKKITGFYQRVARILEKVNYPMAWDSEPVGFDNKYWELSDHFHRFLDKLVFTKDEEGMQSKVRMLISGGQSYDEFHGQMRSGQNTVRCARPFDKAAVTYRCITCSSGSVFLPLCYFCFTANDHKNHEYITDFEYKGVCGCGDPEYSRIEGNCSAHGTPTFHNFTGEKMQSGPLIRYIVLKLIVRILTILRYMGATPPTVTPQDILVVMPDFVKVLISKVSMLKSSFFFFQEIIRYGSPVRDIVASILTDEDLYKTLITGDVPEDPLKCSALSKLDWRSSKHFATFTNLFFNETVLSVFEESAEYFTFRTLLHEFMLYYVFSDFHDVFLDILTALMPNKSFAAAAAKVYYMYYPAIVTFIRTVEHSCDVREEDRKCAHDCCECDLHFSHQVLNDLNIVKYLQEEIDLTFIILSSLQYTLLSYREHAEQVGMKMIPGIGVAYQENSKFPLKDESIEIDSFATLYMVGKDLNLLWKHADMTGVFFSNIKYQRIYIDVLRNLHSIAYVTMPISQKFDMDAFAKAILVEYMVSSMVFKNLQASLSEHSVEQISSYFKELCSVTQDHLSSDTIRMTSSTAFNLPLERQISSFVKYFYQTGLFTRELEDFTSNIVLFQRTLPFFLRELAVNCETKYKLWKTGNLEMRSLLNVTFYSNFRKFFGNLDMYYIRLIGENLPSDEFMDAFIKFFHLNKELYQRGILTDENQKVLVKDRELYDTHKHNLLVHFERFKADPEAPFKYFGLNLSLFKTDIMTSLPKFGIANIQLFDKDSGNNETSFLEFAAVDIMSLLSYLLINPDMFDMPQEERQMIDMVHIVQNHPSKLEAIVKAVYGHGHKISHSERIELYQRVNKVCKVYECPSSRSAGSNKYIVKKEYYEKYWCPVLSLYSHYYLSYYSAACRVLEALDSENSMNDKTKSDFWIPYRIPAYGESNIYTQKIRAVLFSEKLCGLVLTCLALNCRDQLQNTSLQLIVYLLTLSAHYLLSSQQSDREEKISHFFTVYSVSGCKEKKAQYVSIFSLTANLFASYAKKCEDPSKCYESVYNGDYYKLRLIGGPVEYIGRFLSILTELEPKAAVLLAYTCEPTPESKPQKNSIVRKEMQQKIMETARKNSEKLLKKLEEEAKPSEDSSEDNEEEIERKHECPICFDSVEPSDDDVRVLGVLGRSCLIGSMETPFISLRDDYVEEELLGQGSITGLCFKRLARWQKEVAQEQKCGTPNCYIDWRSCGHTFHAKCITNFKNSKTLNSEAYVFEAPTCCSVCRSQIHALLPVRLSINHKEDQTLLCFKEDKVISSAELLNVLTTVMQQIGWKYLDKQEQANREEYYNRTIILLEAGSKRIKPNSSATTIDRIRQQIETLCKLKLRGWEKLNGGPKEGLLKHMIPSLMCKFTELGVRSLIEVVRDLLHPKGKRFVRLFDEKINGYVLNTNSSPAPVREEFERSADLSSDDFNTLYELELYGFNVENEFGLLMRHNLINTFIMIVTAIYESTVSDEDKKAIALILYKRVLAAYLIKTLVLLVPCVTEECSDAILEYKGSGLEGLCKTVFQIRRDNRMFEDIMYYDDTIGLDMEAVMRHTRKSMLYFIRIVQTFLCDLSILNIDQTLEALCDFYGLDDIDGFIPNETFVHNWITELDGTIGYHRCYQSRVPVLSWDVSSFMKFPERFSTLIESVKDSRCSACGNVNFTPVICIICGRCLCEEHLASSDDKGLYAESRSRHHVCHSGYGALISLQTADLIFTTPKNCAVFGKLYLNEFGEETPIVCSELFFVEERLRDFEQDFVLVQHANKSFIRRKYFVETLQAARKAPNKLTEFVTSVL